MQSAGLRGVKHVADSLRQEHVVMYTPLPDGPRREGYHGEPSDVDAQMCSLANNCAEVCHTTAPSPTRISLRTTSWSPLT